MGEIEGTYRVLQTPGSRLGIQKNSGVSTLEPGQNISSAMVSTSPRPYERSIQIKVKLLDNTQEVLDIEVRFQQGVMAKCLNLLFGKWIHLSENVLFESRLMAYVFKSPLTPIKWESVYVCIHLLGI